MQINTKIIYIYQSINVVITIRYTCPGTLNITVSCRLKKNTNSMSKYS